MNDMNKLLASLAANYRQAQAEKARGKAKAEIFPDYEQVKHDYEIKEALKEFSRELCPRSGIDY